MIVTLSQDVCQKLDLIDELNITIQDTGAVKATLEGVSKVQEIAYRLDALLSLLRHRLSDESIQRFVAIVDGLLQEVSISYKNFETEPRQTRQLSSLYAKMQNLIKEIEMQWRMYAQQQTEQPFELLKLVLHLPEMQSQYAALTSIRTRLMYFFEHPPLTTIQLVDFDRALQELTQHLGSIEGLDIEIKTFLQKTLSNQATIADLTDNILQWCQQGKHADAFAIRFAL